jgi:hypothetical protein
MPTKPNGGSDERMLGGETIDEQDFPLPVPAESTDSGDVFTGKTEVDDEASEFEVPTRVDKGQSPPETDDDNEFDVPTRVEGRGRRPSEAPSSEKSDELGPETSVEEGQQE